MLKLDDFTFGKVLDSKELGHIVGGAKVCSTDGATCSSGAGEIDVDDSSGDRDYDEPDDDNGFGGGRF